MIFERHIIYSSYKPYSIYFRMVVHIHTLPAPTGVGEMATASPPCARRSGRQSANVPRRAEAVRFLRQQRVSICMSLYVFAYIYIEDINMCTYIYI